MKNFAYILTILLLSCNSGTEADQTKSVSVLEAEESAAVSPSDMEAMVNFDRITAEKLQEYADLLALEAQHPDFKVALQQRLMAFSEDRLMPGISASKLTIENVKPLGAAEMVSDTVQKIRYAFTIATKNNTVKDTLTAIIVSKKIILAEEERMSYKITFEKQH
jgi:hypothetical protein